MCHQQPVRTVCAWMVHLLHHKLKLNLVYLFLCVYLCSECPKRHLGPVWQLRWNQQDLSLTGEEKVEALFSVGADGRISKWFVFHGGLDCIGTVLNYNLWI